MSKFKVGDLVRVLSSGGRWCHSLKQGSVARVIQLGRGDELRVEGEGVLGGSLQQSIPECEVAPITQKIVAPITQKIVAPITQKIVVTTDGVTTTARQFAGKELVKSAEAKCSPSDTFDFETGAALALDRLLGRDKQAEPEAPKFPREKLQTGVFGRITDGSWFVVLDDKLLYAAHGEDLGGFDYVNDVRADGSIGDGGSAIDCLTKALSFLNAAGKARRSEHLLWSRPGAKFE